MDFFCSGKESPLAEQTHIQASEVHEMLGRHVLTDGMKLVLDLRNSRGSQLVDAQTGQGSIRPASLTTRHSSPS